MVRRDISILLYMYVVSVYIPYISVVPHLEFESKRSTQNKFKITIYLNMFVSSFSVPHCARTANHCRVETPITAIVASDR